MKMLWPCGMCVALCQLNPHQLWFCTLWSVLVVKCCIFFFFFPPQHSWSPSHINSNSYLCKVTPMKEPTPALICHSVHRTWCNTSFRQWKFSWFWITLESLFLYTESKSSEFNCCHFAPFIIFELKSNYTFFCYFLFLLFLKETQNTQTNIFSDTGWPHVWTCWGTLKSLNLFLQGVIIDLFAVAWSLHLQLIVLS